MSDSIALEKMMFRAYLCLAMVTCLSLTLSAKEIPEGTWKWESDLGDQTIRSELEIRSNGTELSGTYRDQNIEVPVEDLKLDGDKLEYVLKTQIDGGKLVATFKGKLDGDKLTGMVGLQFNGEKFPEFEINAKRHIGKRDVLGTWNFDFTSPDGVHRTPTLVISEKDDKLVGEMSANGESQKIEAIQMTDDGFWFEYETPFQGSTLGLKYTCKPRGNQLTGTVEYDFEGNGGDFDVEAKRKQLSEKDQPLLGKWEFSMTTPDGIAVKSTLAITETEGQFSAKLNGQGKDFEIKGLEVKNGEVKFDFSNEHDGLNVDLMWVSSIKSQDEMEGVLSFSVEGNTGDIPIAGKRIK